MPAGKPAIQDPRPCGCHIRDGRIQYCEFHNKVQEMANVLHLIRAYWLKELGEHADKSPFVQKIDKLIPRI